MTEPDRPSFSYKPHADQKGDRSGTELRAALIGAGATLIAAGIGAFVVISTNTITVNVNPQQAPTTPAVTVTPTLTAPANTNSNPADGPALSIPASRHKGDITLLDHKVYDLDSTDPRWGEGASCPSDIGAYSLSASLGIGMEASCGVPGATYVKLTPQDDGTYLKCRTTTGYQGDMIERPRVGDRYCISTDEGRYALITIRSTSAQKIILHALTWEKE